MYSIFSHGNKEKKLTFEGGAEVFWSNLISPIQGGY